ncbi:MAG: GT4 family glycosyltransferase PelF [Thiobacillus sp.]
MTSLPRADRADIALLLEGTYPYVSGGVSSWVYQLIQGFPEYRFACVFLGSRREDYGDPRYALPDNVVHVETHYLHDAEDAPPAVPQRGNADALIQVRRFHEQLRRAGAEQAASLSDGLATLLAHPGMSEDAFLHSSTAWEFITDQYRAHCTDPSFVDYFWTVRGMHRPIWKLQRIARNLIPVSLYHTVSTGYAGFLGTLLKQRTGRPLLLSEHGIYTKERKIDLLQSDWLKDNRDLFQKDPTQISYYRDLWIRFFSSFGKVCYESADQSVALFEANRQRQIEDGASQARTRVIPNGIALETFSPLADIRPAAPPRVFCLIGRVVPIKDVKTFIRAMRIVVNSMPDAEGWIAGPLEEDADYAQECRALAASLGLTDTVRFLGMQKMTELLPGVGVTVLSSISEGLPLVLLEAMAAGVPAVATDVGACRELVEGRNDEDRALGAAGAVVRIADPEALARAMRELLGNEDRWQSASASGKARVARFYRDSQMFDAYRDTYCALLKTPAGQAVPMRCPVSHS